MLCGEDLGDGERRPAAGAVAILGGEPEARRAERELPVCIKRQGSALSPATSVIQGNPARVWPRGGGSTVTVTTATATDTIVWYGYEYGHGYGGRSKRARARGQRAGGEQRTKTKEKETPELYVCVLQVFACFTGLCSFT